MVKMRTLRLTETRMTTKRATMKKMMKLSTRRRPTSWTRT